ncbi:Putative esterase [Acinetobacter baumannii]|nr:Putative esterase [Acinetobacter baumannii]
MHLPDLNRSPEQVVAQVSELIESLQEVALVGSSLGGFFATYFVAKYNIPAVLINPAMQPWKLFDELFQVEQLELKQPENADKILVLLQQGDEILDYRQAQRYYSAATPSSLILTDAHGNHAMEDFEEKLPLVIEFFAHTIK